MARVADTEPTPGVEPRSGQRFAVAAAVFSVVLIACAAWWWLSPEAYPMPAGDPMSLVPGPWTATHTAVLAALGLIGLVTGAAAAALPLSRGARGTVVGTAVAQAVVFLGIVADSRALSVLGYLMALVGPAVVVAAVVIGARRSRTARYLLVGVITVLGAGVLSGIVSASAVGEIATELAIALGDEARMLPIAMSTVAVAGGVVWAGLAWALLTAGRGTVGYGQRAHQRATRWGRWLTIAAALGPVPYLLARLTWLTPWPQFGPAAEEFDAGMRMFGLLLGLAAVAGIVLTIGLIRPWGEVFPTWIPFVGGRVVPPKPPAVIGFTVGLAVAIAGRSFLQLVVNDPDVGVTFLLWMPFPVWGPLLMAASVAYYLRRKSALIMGSSPTNRG